MSDVPRLRSLFERGTLVRPSRDRATTVDLIRAVYRRCGDRDLPANRHVRALEEVIGDSAHFVFVLIDGLGAEIARRCTPDGFFARNRHCTLQPVFPSSTASAVTSFATAEWPAQHGVTTWWMYLPDHGVSATILPYVERFGGRCLRTHGVEPESGFPIPSRLPRLSHEAALVTTATIATSVYSSYLTGGKSGVPYSSPEEAFELTRNRVRESPGRTFTWVYLPGLDAKAHRHGVDSEAVADEARRYELHLDALAADLDGRARIVAVADHGLVDIPEDARHRLTEDDPLEERLEVPISGEPAVPIFHVRNGQEDRFAEQFRRRFGEHFALLTVGEVEQLELLGPGPLSATTRSRLGDFVGIALRPGILVSPDMGPKPNEFRGFHGGLSAQEMSVPLYLA